MLDNVKIYNGDCLEIMPDISDKSVDMILCDLPYGITACKWDSVIPFEPMWKELKRIIKDNGCIALFGSEPFSSALRMSNIKDYKYDWVWDKISCTGNMLAKKQPMRAFELISMFYNIQPVYNPILRQKPARDIRKNNINIVNRSQTHKQSQTKRHQNRTIPFDKSYPTNVIRIKNISRCHKTHPTQKPVELLEYLIKTYTNENETVLDFTMGSGSTGVACINTSRKFIGIEKEEKYFDISKSRINEAIELSSQDLFAAAHNA